MIPDPGSIRSCKLANLARCVLNEFSDVSDYVWKSPNLIEHETQEEQRKLEVYFPGRPDMAELRWQFESRKLTSVFPYLITVGNLFTVISLLEVYLLLLHELMSEHVPIADGLIRGQGANRFISYFKQAGVAVGSVALYEQIQAARRIRNCLVHVAGLLSNSSEETELRRIQATKIYLDPALRGKSTEYEIVLIQTTPLGERLQITNSYSHLACRYARDFLINMCSAIDLRRTSIP